ncbi:hypothetical protein NZNM25_09590 [Nitrosopumilus zosterae]|uniref:Uncharacterized protein n=1 Tax=Nitrosopumilus zosterae TaxID=718286 RepID=A0A2S2KRU3_9ARCH|nr:hypothetical protein NZNM25_09590 [Nitrosopumilus zosterae]
MYVHFLHTKEYHADLPYFVVVNTYCHLCRGGGKDCIDVNENQDYAMRDIDPKCHICGKSLID